MRSIERFPEPGEEGRNSDEDHLHGASPIREIAYPQPQCPCCRKTCLLQPSHPASALANSPERVPNGRLILDPINCSTKEHTDLQRLTIPTSELPRELR